MQPALAPLLQKVERCPSGHLLIDTNSQQMWIRHISWLRVFLRRNRVTWARNRPSNDQRSWLVNIYWFLIQRYFVSSWSSPNRHLFFHHRVAKIPHIALHCTAASHVNEKETINIWVNLRNLCSNSTPKKVIKKNFSSYREGFTKKRSCSFGFCTNEGGRALPKFFGTLHNGQAVN